MADDSMENVYSSIINLDNLTDSDPIFGAYDSIDELLFDVEECCKNTPDSFTS